MAGSRRAPPARRRTLLAVLVLVLTSCTAGPEVAVLEMADGGEIRILLRADVAPATVANFKKLARSGFYDKTTFHVVVPGLLIQGGDPNTKNEMPEDDGYGGPGYTIEDEPNELSHTRGVVSMALVSRRPDSAGSQFFILLSDRGDQDEPWADQLDGTHTAFGEVVAGLDVAERISRAPRGGSGFPGQELRPDVDQVVASVRIEPTP